MNDPPSSGVRAARPEDFAAMARLSAELGYPVEQRAFGQRLSRVLDSDVNLVLVAETADAGIAGWIHGAERELLESGVQCEILGLVVAAAARRRGLGRALVAAIERWAAQRGRSEVSVRSNVIRPDSHPFYESLSYVRVKTQHVYRKRVPAARAPSPGGLHGSDA